ncbi:MAG TPA: terminase TerL endonuclease subunit [Acidisarcina sp.]|nr:terminase TerL endonuclease subunit [Acidisarcina sp.]
MAKRSVAEKYIADVLAGRILTSKLVRLEIERHVRDLKDGAARGLIFDRKAAQHVIDFFPLYLLHTEGEYCDQPFVLLPFQQAQLWILYGWKWKATGYRRFKFAYNEIGRGNGKSAFASGLCIYELKFFGEPGAQVYSASTDKKTAKLVFDTADLMVKKSEWLSERILCSRDNLSIAGTASKFEPCASEDMNLMGLRPSFVVLDELHAHRTSGVWDVFVTAMGKRRNPLLFAITNSGYDRHSVCWNQREYSTKVLLGIIEDDTWFAWICGLDDGDDWEDERNWIKANPALGFLVRIEDMRSQAAKAKADPSALNSFLRFRLSVWTSSHSAWMPMDKWDLCATEVDRLALRGRRCFGGLDLSTTIDISAFVLVFPPEGDDKQWYVIPYFFLPEEAIESRSKRDRVPYDVWARQGLFTLTPGDVIDYDFIRSQVNELAAEYEIKEIAYDPYNAQQLVTQLTGDGFEMVVLRQGFLSLNAPTKRLMELVLTGVLAHGGNPVLRWMASNVMVAIDAAGCIKPDKAASREKIDGIAALVDALARAIVAPAAPKRKHAFLIA